MPILGTQQELAELDYQIKRLSHHPSIAMWDGCNECGGGGLYASWGMTKVVEVDKSRPIWPSCPANGWANGASTLNSRPNGGALDISVAVRPAGENGYPWQVLEPACATRLLTACIVALLLPASCYGDQVPLHIYAEHV